MKKFSTVFLLIIGILTIYIARAILGSNFPLPSTFDFWNTLTILGSIFVCGQNYRRLIPTDWLLAFTLSLLVGVGMQFTTLFTPYPFLGIISSNPGQGILRGAFSGIAVLGGLTIMRMDGPVTFHLACRQRNRSIIGIGIGLGIGAPLAIINVYALQTTQGYPIEWQHPLAALTDALQPAIVEEIIYRFALWGLLWLLLRTSLPKNASWLSGLLAMLIHNFSHFDDLFQQSPLAAVVMALVWGVPPLLLARKKGLESAIAFHWIQDVGRFLAGF